MKSLSRLLLLGGMLTALSACSLIDVKTTRTQVTSPEDSEAFARLEERVDALEARLEHMEIMQKGR